jgi:hypothetical protein
VLYGTSQSSSRVIGEPAAAALIESAPPDEKPSTAAEPPAAPSTAFRSSISRSTAYGAVSPLSPLPRRS